MWTFCHKTPKDKVEQNTKCQLDEQKEEQEDKCLLATA
jgi:hypothetical protein